jgi:TRAP-type C4-dicarboxylate transport system permease small subunit
VQLVFNTLRGYFELFLEAITIFLMVSLALVVLIAVAYRLGGHSLTWYDEVAAIQLAWLTYYAGALAALKRAHIGVTGIVNAMPPAVRVPVVLLAECIVIGFFALMGWLGIEVLQVLEGDTLISLPEVPTTLTQSVIPIGAALFIIAQILSFPEILDNARKGPPHTGTEVDEP